MVFPGERYGRWALVAGAAEGIGEGFTIMLAKLGFNLILADKQADLLKHLAGLVRSDYGVATKEVIIDLADSGAADKLEASASDCQCRLLIYVAAYSRVQRFAKLNVNDIDGFCYTNVFTLLHITHRFIKRMTDEGSTGGIVLVSSLAGLIGPQFVASYSATKAFSIRLAESLHQELKTSGIDIIACCPGVVLTPSYRRSNPNFRKVKPPVQEPTEVARYALTKLGKKPVCIPGLTNRIQYFILCNLIPGRSARYLVNNAMEKMYGNL